MGNALQREGAVDVVQGKVDLLMGDLDSLLMKEATLDSSYWGHKVSSKSQPFSVSASIVLLKTNFKHNRDYFR
jgi:hypothetical protein